MKKMLSGSDRIDFEVVDPRSAAATTAMVEYFAELSARLSKGFEPGATLTEDAEFFEAPHGVFVLARTQPDAEALPSETVVGCGGVRLLSSEVGEIKRMWISNVCRGRGFGRLLLATLEDHAAGLGAQRVRLDTNMELVEAIKMYETSGYSQIEKYNDNPFAQRWFEKELGTNG